MAATNINRVVLTGNLCKDPDSKALPSGTALCELRIACNTRRKNGQSGEWEDRPNFFNVKVFGAQATNCARYLGKGRPVGIDGRLEWREWETQDGAKRQAVEIIAENVQFLGSREATAGDEVEYDEKFEPVPAGVGAEDNSGDDDEIPF